MSNRELWERYRKYVCVCEAAGLRLDISRMRFGADFLERMRPAMERAMQAMAALESGAIANPDEQRMVGHYWLRSPERAPSPEIRKDIEATRLAIREFTARVHNGSLAPQRGGRFTRILSIGIGGSALGPQFLADALGTAKDVMRPHFLDNTDPDGMQRVFAEIGDDLKRTLTIVISKSGGTIETRNGMLEAAHVYRRAGLAFEKHAVAITGVGSRLDNEAISGNWLSRFPMWDWVGGRTSVLSAVGLLPAALQGINIEELLQGAADVDEYTRKKDIALNPSALLSLMWFHATKGRGERDMVILPYKDRLVLFPKYLQQLIMESLGKEKDLDGKTVNQGITVYGNKGTTDQHAYVQQLRDGVNNFFATFIEVLRDQDQPSLPVEPDITSGDYLSSFYQGTRNALYENGRESMTISLEKLDVAAIGALIGLYERAVGFYANLVNINAYHQPGVEAGKKMAGTVIKLQGEVLAFLRKERGTSFTAEAIARGINAGEHVETIFTILEHARANPDHGVQRKAGRHLCDSTYEAA